jgi:hypothetical protein
MKTLRLHAAFAVLTLLASACGSGGGGGGDSTPTPTPTPTTLRGIALPGEVSALPTQDTMAPATLRALRAHSFLFLPEGSDYAQAKSFKYVSERSLCQFDILNTVFNAMAQTHYDDAAVLNQGPYAAVVTWEEK